MKENQTFTSRITDQINNDDKKSLQRFYTSRIGKWIFK